MSTRRTIFRILTGGGRFALFMGLALVFVAHSGLIAICASRVRRRKAQAKVLSSYAALLLRIFGIRVELRVEGPLNFRSNHLFVSNHLSYIDALVIAARFPSAFITSFEVREMPLLGLLARLGGCLFVERRNRRQLLSEERRIARALFSGLDVVAFPEATSSDGRRVLPFKSMVFGAAKRARVPVVPLCLEYPPDGRLAHYYGEMRFLPHFMRFLVSPPFTVRLKILGEIEIQSPTIGRKELRDEAYGRIRDAYSERQSTDYPEMAAPIML